MMTRLFFILFLVCTPVLAAAEKPAQAEAPIVTETETDTKQDPLLDVQIIKSKNGLTAWLVEDHSVPVIAVNFGFLNAGSKQDPEDKQGLARLLSNTLDEGAGDMDAKAFQDALRDHSISLSYSVSRDAFTGSLKTLTRHKDKAFDLLALSLTKPRFDDDAVDRMRAANINRIQSSLANPEWLAARIMNDVLYEGHPYVLNSGGTLSSLPNIMPDDLRNFHGRALTQENLRIAITGDIKATDVKAMLDDVFGDLPKKAELQEVANIDLQNQGQIVLYEEDIPQTIIQMAQPAFPRGHEDYHTAQVMNFVLGSSGFGSRLTKVIREERGLTYGIYTWISSLDHTASLALDTSTKNKAAKEMLSLIKTEWQRIQNEPITAEELENAQTYLIGSLPISLSSTDRIAGTLLNLQLDDLAADYFETRAEAIQAVTIDDVQALAKQLLDTDALTTVLVGKPKGIKADRIIEDIPNAR